MYYKIYMYQELEDVLGAGGIKWVSKFEYAMMRYTETLRKNEEHNLHYLGKICSQLRPVVSLVWYRISPIS